MKCSDAAPPPRRGVALYALIMAAALVGSRVEAGSLIKVATLAPEGSSWVQALRAIDTEVRERTDGEVAFKIYPGGVQGDEDVMLRKIRVGQLQGGGFGGIGVSTICPDVLALEMPFLFENYDEVEHVLDQTIDYYRAAYRQAGYEHLGWADAGFVYLLSRDPVPGQSAIRGRKVWRMQGEPITEVLFAKAGVTSVPLAIPDVLLGLQTNLVEVVYASPAAAIVLQWFTRVKYFTDLPINYIVGAMLIEARAFDRLTPKQQTAVREAASRALVAQRQQSRVDNGDALAVFAREGLVRVTPAAEEIAGFEDLVRRSEPDLVGHAFSAESYDLVRQHLEDYRRQRGRSEQGPSTPK